MGADGEEPHKIVALPAQELLLAITRSPTGNVYPWQGRAGDWRWRHRDLRSVQASRLLPSLAQSVGFGVPKPRANCAGRHSALTPPPVRGGRPEPALSEAEGSVRSYTKPSGAYFA